MSVAYLGFIPAKSRTEHPKEWQPLKTNKNCVRYGRKATYYFPTCQLNEFARINVKQTYYLILQTEQTTTSLKRNLFRREEVRNNRMSAALSYVYVFIKKWITPYLTKINKGSWTFCWCDTRTKNNTLLKNNINFNKKPSVKKKLNRSACRKKGEQSCTSPSRASRIFISIYKKRRILVFFLRKNCDQSW